MVEPSSNNASSQPDEHRLIDAEPGPMPTKEPIKAWRAILEVHAQIMPQMARVFAQEFDLSVSDFDVLVNIAPGESLRHRELSQRVILSRSALSRLIDRLVARGFVIRSEVESDSRGVLIELTSTGAALRKRALRRHDELVINAFTGLTEAECAHLTMQLRTLLSVHQMTEKQRRDGFKP